MFLETRDEWEVENSAFKAVIGTNIHRYPMVRISLNINLFHVDILNHTEDPDLEIWDRYILIFVHDLLNLISLNFFKKIKISIQPPLCIGGEHLYEITRVIEIIEKNDNGNIGYIFRCINDKTYLDSHYLNQSENSINKRVYVDCDI